MKKTVFALIYAVFLTFNSSVIYANDYPFSSIKQQSIKYTCVHTILKGDTLDSVVKLYGVKSQDIINENKLKTNILNQNDELYITIKYPIVTSKGKSMSEFVPNGWYVMESVKGDLNKDSLPDIALILGKKVPTMKTSGLSTNSYSHPRIFVIITQNKDKTYKKSVQSNDAVAAYGYKQSFDWYDHMKIEKGTLLFDYSEKMHSTFRGYQYKFAYQKGGWFFTGLTTSKLVPNEHIAETIIDTNFQTGDIVTKEIVDGKIKSTKKTKVKVQPLVNLMNFAAN